MACIICQYHAYLEYAIEDELSGGIFSDNMDTETEVPFHIPTESVDRANACFCIISDTLRTGIAMTLQRMLVTLLI